MKLYGYRNGRTPRALWALEEVGAGYEYVQVDVLHSEGREPWFLEINPGGKVPLLDDEGTIVTESAAICLHLAEKYSDAGLLPAVGTPERTECYKWISFILTELDALLWTIAKRRFGLPRERRVPAVIETSSCEFRNAVKLLADALEQRQYLTGGPFSVADILARRILIWAQSARLRLASEVLSICLEPISKLLEEHRDAGQLHESEEVRRVVLPANQ